MSLKCISHYLSRERGVEVMKSKAEEPKYLLILILPGVRVRDRQGRVCKCEEVAGSGAGVHRSGDVEEVVALLSRFLPREEMRVDVRHDEIDALLLLHHCAVCVSVGGDVAVLCGVVTTGLVDFVDGALNEGCGAAGAGAEVYESVGWEGLVEDGLECLGD